MKIENLNNLAVSETTKEWVRRVIELDELYENVRKQLIEFTGSEDEARKILLNRMDNLYKDMRGFLAARMSYNILENISDICSTEI